MSFVTLGDKEVSIDTEFASHFLRYAANLHCREDLSDALRKVWDTLLAKLEHSASSDYTLTDHFQIYIQKMIHWRLRKSPLDPLRQDPYREKHEVYSEFVRLDDRSGFNLVLDLTAVPHGDKTFHIRLSVFGTTSCKEASVSVFHERELRITKGHAWCTANRLKNRRREAFESLMSPSSEADRSRRAELAAEQGQDSDFFLQRLPGGKCLGHT